MASAVEWRSTPEGVKPFVDGKQVDWAPLPGSQSIFLSCPVPEVLLEGNRGGGKDLRTDVPVLTQRGWVPAGDVRPTDTLVALDGSPARILGIYPKSDRPMCRLTFEDGAEVEADLEHRWRVRSATNAWRDGWVVRTTAELMASPGVWHVPYITGPVPGTAYYGPDPYVAGMLLGDGTLRSARVCLYSADDELLDATGWRQYRYPGQVARAVCPESESGAWRRLLPAVKADTKRVPTCIMTADPRTRLAVLQGLLDTDGSVDKQGRVTFFSVSEGLARDVADLAWSLGGSASVRFTHKPSPKGGRDHYWKVHIAHHNRFAPFRLRRKAARVRPTTRFQHRRIVKIERIDNADGVCFAVDHPSQCFVVRGYVVTHNTDVLLMDFYQHVGQGYRNHWRGILFRRTFPELKDVIDRSHEWFNTLCPAAKYNQTDHVWTFPQGETLKFAFFEIPVHYWKYHGHQYPWIAWEELCLWPSDECFKSVFVLNRSKIPGIPLKIRATTNPYGVGHNWVKARYRLPVINPANGNVVGRVIRTQGQPDRVAIHSHLHENHVLLSAQPDYEDKIRAAAKNEAMLRAWLHGDWEIVAGGMLDDVWQKNIHVVPRIPLHAIPKHWRITRAYDHGQSKPFSCGWWAISNGEPLKLPDGREIGQVPGDVVRIAEWYGCVDDKPNEGVRMLSVDIGRGIAEREERWGIAGRVEPGPADNQIFSAYEPGKSVAGDMRRHGIIWTESDKTPGSRKRGWEAIRVLLQGAKGGVREDRGMFVFDSCYDFIRTMPTLPRSEKDPDDVDTEAEDHIGDETRYFVLRKDRRVRQGFQ